MVNDKIAFTNDRHFLFDPSARITFSVIIEGLTDVFAAKEAIYAAVSQHELLCSRIELDETGRCYYVPTASPNVSITILDENSSDILQDLIRQQERIPFALNEGELVRFFLQPMASGRMELILMAHHLAGDGISLMYLIRDIMQVLSGQSSRRFKPISLYEIASLDKSKLSHTVKIMINSLTTRWKRRERIFGFTDYSRMYDNYWKERSSSYVCGALYGEEIERLQHICRQQGVRISSAIVTAFLAAAGENEEFGIAASIRPDGYEGMGNYFSDITVNHEYDKSVGFWENAQEVQTAIIRKVDVETKKLFMLNFIAALPPTLVDSVFFCAYSDEYHSSMSHAAAKMFDYYSPKGMDLINLNRAAIPQKYGNYTLSQLLFIPPSFANFRRTLGAVTMGNTLTISMHYLSGNNDQKEQDMFEKALELLRSNC